MGSILPDTPFAQLIVFLVGANWEFLLIPTLLGAIMLVVVALVYNNLSTERSYR
jgi:CBS-domain-containing membrane protein